MTEVELSVEGGGHRSSTLRLHLKNSYVVNICIALTLLRIIVSWLLGNWLPGNDELDSALMVNYANVFEHFSEDNINSLCKTMSYPLFLLLPSLVGISYNVLLSLLWVLAALSVSFAFSRLTANKVILGLIYLIIIWNPIAFDCWGGYRIYRNSIIAPTYFLLFGLLMLFFFNAYLKIRFSKKELLSVCGIAISLGIVFTFAVYIKEDGYWMYYLGSLVLISVVIVIFINVRKKKYSTISAVFFSFCIALIPLLVFNIGTNLYERINERYFGVAEINTRTEGELANFLKNIYKIESSDQTARIWASHDQIIKAYNASPTFQENPELLNNILNNIWFGTEEVGGDFYTWVLRTSLVSSGLWKSESYVQNLFKKINNEIEESFKDGTLKATSKFFITSSMGPRSFTEIKTLADDVTNIFDSVFTLRGYEVGRDLGTLRSDPNLTKEQLYFLDQSLITTDNYGVSRIEQIKTKIGSYLSNIDFITYRFLAPLLGIFGVLGLVLALIVGIVFRRTLYRFNAIQWLFIVIGFLFAALALIYALAIGWFCEFFVEGSANGTFYLKFYSTGIIPMVYLPLLIGTYFLFLIIKRFRLSRKKNITKFDRTAFKFNMNYN